MRLSPVRRRRAFATLAFLATGSLVLAGCGTSEEPDGEDAADPVELRMTVWSANEGHHELLNQIGAAYAEANPDKVTGVAFDALTNGDYISALTTQIAGGQSPDLAWVPEGYAAQFVDAGVFLDLTPTLTAAEGYDYDDLIPGAIELWSKDGDLYGYPFSNSPFGIYVNNDLLEAAGQPNPRDLIASGDWTWDKLIEIAGATAKSQGVAGFQPAANAESEWNDALAPMWLSWGASAWSEDGGTCTLTSPEMVDFFTWYHDAVYADGAIIAPGQEFDFASGQIAARISQLSMSTGLADKFNWDFLPLPSGPAGTVPVVGQGGVGALSQGEHPEIAADFLAFFTNAENTELLARYFPPARQSLLDVDTLTAAASALSEEQIQGTIVEQSAVAVTKPGNPQMSVIADPVRIALDALWTADADVKAVLSAGCDAMTPRLAGN